jgi:hypothetical protein
MSEEQRKPAKKWHKKRINIFIFVLLLLACVTITLIVLLRGQPDGTCYSAWCTVRNQIQYSVNAYAENHSGALPTLSGSYTNANCSSCHAVNMSTLLRVNGGVMRNAPPGLNLSTSGNDNCGGNASLGCVNGGHYIWIVDKKGIVYSYCAGYGCPCNNSGPQGVWP